MVEFHRKNPSTPIIKLIGLSTWIVGLVVGSFNIGSAAQTNTVDAINPGGPGKLTKRLDWLVTSSRRTYHHIHLPARIAIGDTITLSYGSNTKTYEFPVARITLEGNHCEIFSQTQVHHRADKINITPCYPADQRRATVER